MSESIENAVNEFYKLKDAYERSIANSRSKIVKSRSLSLKEKRDLIKKIQPLCINCKRPGGSIFSVKFNKDPNVVKQPVRQLKAFCGVVSNPCNLYIYIELGLVELLPDVIRDTEDSIKKLKKSVIDDKNKLLFGQLSSEDALENFNNIKEELSDSASYLEILLELFFKSVDNKETAKALSEDITKSYDYIKQIKDCIQQFNQTDSTQFVRDAIHIYDTSLKPLLNNIMDLKYKQNFVWYNDDTNTYHLIQNKYTIKDLEDNLTESKLQSFIMGMDTQNKDDFTKNDDGSIVWSNSANQSVWNKINEETKQALLTDPKWMKEFVSECVVSKEIDYANVCEFTPPSNLLKNPPKILANGKYDLGNKYYSNFFDKIDKEQQRVLLALFTQKDNGEKDYTEFKDALSNMISQSLKFEQSKINISKESL